MLLKPLRALVLASALILSRASAGPGPVEFDFVAPDDPSVANPYARELWAEVVTPSGQKLALPAYYADGGLYAVRARADETGPYRFGSVSETTLGIRRTGLVVSLVTPAEVQIPSRIRLPSVGIDPRNPRGFIRSDGLPYVPVGANLAWKPDSSTGDTAGYYAKAFPAFSKANLNWMRIWMAHWDGLNLDWMGEKMGPSPKPGSLNESVAETWDKIISLAEDNGVYVQMVLQHHGQYTTYNDSDWPKNPWNAANPGGFLKSPGDFFNDPNAAVISMLKYRYIVARWGYSPAVLSWELFNEVHWTNAFREGHEVDVARWHSNMATAIRQVDVYGHLITTSTENLRSPIYEKLDYYQPHLYAANLLAGARTFVPAYSTLNKPAFYGEQGDDHQPVSDAVKQSGLNIIPPVWASVMGQGDLAAQTWNGWQLLEQDRLNELGAVFRFLVINRVASQQGLVAFSAPIECSARVPLGIEAGEVWQRRPPATIDVPLDGRVSLDEANIPSTLTGSDLGRADGFPDSVTYRLDMPRGTRVRVQVDSAAPAGGALVVRVDGAEVASHVWPAGTGAPNPAAIEFPLSKGPHTLSLSNPGPDWVGVSGIDLGLDRPALSLIGRRNDRFIIAWVWHRANLHALSASASASGTVLLDNVPAGTWKVTWWDSVKGTPGASSAISHPGGTLKLPTPPVTRHAAVVLVRTP